MKNKSKNYKDKSFDKYVSGYDQMHRSSITASGETPEYFARYKHRLIKKLLGTKIQKPILDFGCGLGNLTCPLSESFKNVDGYDSSPKCIDFAKKRVPNVKFYATLSKVPKYHYRAVIIANVLHHVPPQERMELLKKVHELLLPDGLIIIFEHNPLNPLTRLAVSKCEFDKEASLLWPWEVTNLLKYSKYKKIHRNFIIFFPHLLSKLRPIEKNLSLLPIGAQIMVWGEKN